jgi:hypothetical protein
MVFNIQCSAPDRSKNEAVSCNHRILCSLRIANGRAAGSHREKALHNRKRQKSEKLATILGFNQVFNLRPSGGKGGSRAKIRQKQKALM